MDATSFETNWLAQARLTQARLMAEMATLEGKPRTTTIKQRIAQVRSDWIALNVEINLHFQRLRPHV